MIKTLSYLLPYISRYKRKYIWGAIFVLFTNIFRILNPRIIQDAIDYLSSEFELMQLASYSGLIILVAIFEGVFLFLMRKSMIVASREIENDLRNDLFSRLINLPQSFYQTMPTGDIMSRATNDLTAVRSVMGPGIAYSTNTIMAFMFVIPMMLTISPKMTIFALLPFPLVALLVNRFGKAIYNRFKKVQDQFSVLSTIAQENLSGHTMIKWFAREENQMEQFEVANREYMVRNIDHAKVFAAFRPALMLTIGLSIAIILLVGGQLIIAEVITLGEFTAFMLYMNMLIFPSIALGWVIGLLQQGAAALSRMSGVLESESDLKSGDRIIDIKQFESEIVFRNLTFAYEDQRPVLHNINLTISAHQTLGILGPTGSGKTTLIKLITNLYRLNPGQLFINGIDIVDYDLKSLRQQIGYVPQETFLFSDTIRNNIAYGNADADQDAIEQAAQLADIHDQIMEFPDGYDSVLGEKGLNLSGGQKQRLSIARAIIRNPQILIFDDAFSALDTQTEARILENLKTVLPNRTVILISHRVSTLQHADSIIVLQDGHITETGTHEELLTTEGHYAWIHEKQLLEAELESVD